MIAEGAVMVTIPVKTRIQPDGTLDLRLSTGLPESDVEVVVVIQPAAAPSTWPEDFFERTYGAFAEHPIERPPQGEFDGRETLS
jgi:hypothetical protein